MRANMTTDDKTEYIAEHAHMVDAARAVSTMISQLLPVIQRLDEGVMELEGRLGRIGPSGFDPNIGSPAFCSILEMLDSYQGWSHVSQWEETQDFFFSVK